ncbi:hypothetical protein BUZ60_11945, partial [Staphylococcus nepalensis]
AKDSNIKSEIDTLYSEYLFYYLSKLKKDTTKNQNHTDEIFKNEVKVLKGDSIAEIMDNPYFDLNWLISQRDYEVFYGRKHLTKSETIYNNKLTPKNMYYYNTLDNNDLNTIKKLIEAYLDSKYHRVKNEKEFFNSAVDIDNLESNRLSNDFLE